MQTGDNLDYFKKYHISSKIFKEYLEKNNWIYQTFGKDAGPSLNYINPEYKGKFGIIAPYSKDFCKSCNRLRITSKGDLRLCLFGNTGISIRHLLQKDNQTEELKDLPHGVVWEEFCTRHNMPVGQSLIKDLEGYQNSVSGR